MTAEEREMLTDLANKIAQTPTPALDLQADEFIRANIGKREDALYILTQTVLIQNLAIQHAQQELQELKQRAAQAPQAGSSFLGGLLRGGSHAAPPQPQPQHAAPPPPQYSAPPASAPGFLRSAAQTAAGVAAGALAFEGIRALFGGASWGRPQAGSFLGGTGETIVNNYYDSRDDDSARAAADDSGDVDSADDSEVANDSADDSNSSDDTDSANDSDSSFEDASYNDTGSSGDDFA